MSYFKFNKFYKEVALILSVIIFCFALIYFIWAWTEPTAAPPSGNVFAPLNVSSVGQTKTGNLTVGTAAQGIYAPSFIDFNNNSWKIDPSGNSYFSGNVGIGTTAPGAKLDVAGNFKVTGNSNTCHLVYFSTSPSPTLCPAGYYTWDAVAAAPTGYMMCCKVDNPI